MGSLAKSFDYGAERLGVQSGVTDQPGLDPQELLPEEFASDETRLEHGINIGQIASVATFKF